MPTKLQNNNTTLQTLIDDIEALPNYVDTTDGTATSADILKGKVAYSKATRITGTIENNGAVNGTIDYVNTTSYTIPAGYTTGGTVTLSGDVDSIATTQADLISQASTKVSGKGVTPSVEQATPVITYSSDGSGVLTATCNQGAGKVAGGTTKTTATSPHLKPEYIRKGYTIFGVNGAYEGSSLQVELVTTLPEASENTDGKIYFVTDRKPASAWIISPTNSITFAGGQIIITYTDGGRSDQMLTRKVGQNSTAGFQITEGLYLSQSYYWDGTSKEYLDGYFGESHIDIDGNRVHELRKFSSNIPPSGAFADMSWEDISIVCKAGLAADYWSVGDTKNITIDGASWPVQILGFNHDDVTDPLTYGRSKAGISLSFVNVYKKGVANAENYSDGTYWAPDSTHPNAIRSKNLKQFYENEISAELKKFIVQVNKKCAINKSGPELTDVADYTWIISYKEITGSTGTVGLYNEGIQYDFYKAGNSRKKAELGSTNGRYWWTRTPNQGSALYNYVTSDGSLSSAYVSNTNIYYVPCFCV